MNKYFLLCKQCEYPNEVKTQYLTFCAGCGKKLDNSYSIWSMDHPKSSFDDYLHSECKGIDEKLLQKPDQVKVKSKSPVRFWLGTLVGIAFIAAIGLSVHINWSSLIGMESVTQELLDGEWERFEAPEYGYSFDTPFKLEPMKLNVPPEVKGIIKDMRTDNYSRIRGVQIISNVLEYNAAVGQVNLSGSAEGSINSIKNMPGVSNLDYQQKELLVAGVPAFRQDGTLLLNGDKGRFVNVCAGQGLKLYQLSLIFPAKDKLAIQLANRMIQSIKIK